MKAKEFAKEWIETWNSHDMDRILTHYADDIEITTPMIRRAGVLDVDSLTGKEAVKEYWQKALKKFPDLKFELIEVTEGVNSVAIYYKTVLDKKAIEVMFFDDANKVNRMFAYYS